MRVSLAVQSYMGLAKQTGGEGNVWQMDKDLGADEDDGSFMETSPVDDAPADDDEEPSFVPTGKPAAKGTSHSSVHASSAILSPCGSLHACVILAKGSESQSRS